MFPKYLYRYRPASLKAIEALRTNRLYFSTANYYDDPFDTFINIDLGWVWIKRQTSFGMKGDMIDGRANNISKEHHKTDPLSLRGEYAVESKPA